MRVNEQPRRLASALVLLACAALLFSTGCRKRTVQAAPPVPATKPASPRPKPAPVKAEPPPTPAPAPATSAPAEAAPKPAAPQLSPRMSPQQQAEYEQK